MSESDFIELEAAAKILHMGISSLRKLIKDKKIPAYKPAKKVLIKREDLERFIKKSPAA